MNIPRHIKDATSWQALAGLYNRRAQNYHKITALAKLF
jgi:hypothetical protein